ncbi:MAG: hypothetical protein WAL42_04650 [Nitrososphaeraceae archaeon]|jgi:hypothetical protein
MALSEENVSHDKIQRSVNDWRTKYPNAAAIFEKIPSMDLKEVVSTMFLVDGVRWLLKIRAMRLSLVEDKEPLDLIEDKVSDNKVEETIRKLRTKHPMAATILEKIHNMDLKETTMAMFAIDSMEKLLKLRASLILVS